MRPGVLVALVLISAGTARAEETERSSRTVTTLLVFGGSTASLPLLLGAMTAHDAATQRAFAIAAVGSAVIGPSLGRWYTRDPAWGGLLVRGLGVGVFVLAAGMGGDEEPPAFLFAPGLLLLAGGTIYDLYQTPRSLAHRNRPLGITPTVLVTPTNAAAPGLVIGRDF